MFTNNLHKLRTKLVWERTLWPGFSVIRHNWRTDILGSWLVVYKNNNVFFPLLNSFIEVKLVNNKWFKFNVSLLIFLHIIHLWNHHQNSDSEYIHQLPKVFWYPCVIRCSCSPWFPIQETIGLLSIIIV